MAQVLPATSPHDSPPYFSSTPPIGYSSTPRQAIIVDAGALSKSLERSRAAQDRDLGSAGGTSEPSSLSSSPLLGRSSSGSTPASSVSLDKSEDGDYGDELSFPTFDNAKFEDSKSEPKQPTSPVAERSHDIPASASDSTPTNESVPSSPAPGQVNDDSAVHEEPSIQVDYLSHEWHEEDIWRSWKHIVSNRRVYGERSRLENASWRTWAKAKYRLRTVSPERLNWLKDCDVTWLYGPLQEASWRRNASEPTSKLSKSNSFINKKPILKKRSVSEIMLQKSISTSSLVKQAAAAVQAQRECMQNGDGDRSRLHRAPSDFLGCVKTPAGADPTTLPSALPSYSSSGIHSPDGCRRHIRFDDKVEQCIAVEFQTAEPSEAYESSIPNNTDESASSSEDELVMMRPRSSKSASASSSRRSSIGQDSTGIAMLPATTLNDRGEELAQQEEQSLARGSHTMGRLSHSPSQETLKPKNPAANFLIADDDDCDISWTPSDAWGGSGRDGNSAPQEESEEEYSVGLRRTPSGMFMPFDDDEEEQGYASTGVLGRVVETVNTARDIMHVIMNVGWRS